MKNVSRSSTLACVMLIAGLVACGCEPRPGSSAPTGASSAAASASAAVTTAADAAARATPVANAALDKAYVAGASANPGGARRVEPWVKADGAQVTGDATKGWTVTWSSHPPAGYEYDATVTVSPSGAVTVTRATATFSPD